MRVRLRELAPFKVLYKQMEQLAYTLTLVSSNWGPALTKASTLQCNLPLKPADLG